MCSLPGKKFSESALYIGDGGGSVVGGVTIGISHSVVELFANLYSEKKTSKWRAIMYKNKNNLPHLLLTQNRLNRSITLSAGLSCLYRWSLS